MDDGHDGHVDAGERELLDAHRELTPDRRAGLLDMAETLVSAQRAKSERFRLV